MSPIDAKKILGLKDLPMEVFESEIWTTYGRHFCNKSDRSKVNVTLKYPIVEL